MYAHMYAIKTHIYPSEKGWTQELVRMCVRDGDREREIDRERERESVCVCEEMVQFKLQMIIFLLFFCAKHLQNPSWEMFMHYKFEYVHACSWDIAMQTSYKMQMYLCFAKPKSHETYFIFLSGPFLTEYGLEKGAYACRCACPCVLVIRARCKNWEMKTESFCVEEKKTCPLPLIQVGVHFRPESSSSFHGHRTLGVRGSCITAIDGGALCAIQSRKICSRRKCGLLVDVVNVAEGIRTTVVGQEASKQQVNLCAATIVTALRLVSARGPSTWLKTTVHLSGVAKFLNEIILINDNS